MKRKVQDINRCFMVTMPIAICEHFGIGKGDVIDFRIEKDHIIGMPVHPSAKMTEQAANTPKQDARSTDNDKILA